MAIGEMALGRGGGTHDVASKFESDVVATALMGHLLLRELAVREHHIPEVQSTCNTSHTTSSQLFPNAWTTGSTCHSIWELATSECSIYKM